jgi:DNA-directed RNA polymerase subunit beta
VKAGSSQTEDVQLYTTDEQVKHFEQDIAVGYMYILKLHHMVEDKIHMRSIGPYSLITQQPLGGKAQGGGQRFGEMEVWALEGYGAAHTSSRNAHRSSPTISRTFSNIRSIIKGEKSKTPNTPASFSVMLELPPWSRTRCRAPQSAKSEAHSEDNMKHNL